MTQHQLGTIFYPSVSRSSYQSIWTVSTRILHHLVCLVCIWDAVALSRVHTYLQYLDNISHILSRYCEYCQVSHDLILCFHVSLLFSTMSKICKLPSTEINTLFTFNSPLKEFTVTATNAAGVTSACFVWIPAEGTGTPLPLGSLGNAA